jgi:transposase
MLLTMKDQQRIEAIEALMDGRLSAAQAAQVLGRSERHTWRLLARAREDGLSGLIHGNRGREPVNKSDSRLWRRVLKLAGEKYRGVNDRHLQELLAREHGITVCRESLRKRLRAAGLEPKRSRRPSKYRSRRERRAAAGMLLQIDASPHDWLEGRGPRLTPVGVIDDATNHCWVRFSVAETTWAYLRLMREVALSEGLPLAPLQRPPRHLPRPARADPLRAVEQPAAADAVRPGDGGVRCLDHPGLLAAGEGADRAALGRTPGPAGGGVAARRRGYHRRGECFAETAISPATTGASV